MINLPVRIRKIHPQLEFTIRVVQAFSWFEATEKTVESFSCTRLSSRWYFAMISMSGAFSVTFSVIFAYVADVTDERERSTAYGLVRTLVGHFANSCKHEIKWCLGSRVVVVGEFEIIQVVVIHVDFNHYLYHICERKLATLLLILSNCIFEI